MTFCAQQWGSHPPQLVGEQLFGSYCPFEKQNGKKLRWDFRKQSEKFSHLAHPIQSLSISKRGCRKKNIALVGCYSTKNALFPKLLLGKRGKLQVSNIGNVWNERLTSTDRTFILRENQHQSLGLKYWTLPKGFSPYLLPLFRSLKVLF